MRRITKKKIERTNFSLIEVIIITLAFCSITGIIVGLSVYFINNRNLILDSELLDIVDTYNKITKNYYGKLDKSDLATSAIEGMMQELNEQYSVYMDTSDTSNLSEKLDGEYRGIGIGVQSLDGIITIVKVYKDTPAYEAGLKENDIIKQVGDYVVLENDDIDKVSSMIKKSDKVTLKVLRGEEEKDITVSVKKIESSAIDYKMFDVNDKKIGYIYLSTFSKTAANQVRNALLELEKNGMTSLIFDVRSNTGGYLDTADEILKMFIKKGKVLYYLEDNKGKTAIHDNSDEYRDYDMVVLTNQGSASASEILASSLKESYGALVVGTTTYGKGLVQQTSGLSHNSMIKYTTAKWYTPDGNYVNGIGYKPGIESRLTAEYVKNPCDETDAQLQTALSILSNKD